MEGEPKFEQPKSHYTYFDMSAADHSAVFSCDANNDNEADQILLEKTGHCFGSGDLIRSSTEN